MLQKKKIIKTDDLLLKILKLSKDTKNISKSKKFKAVFIRMCLKKLNISITKDSNEKELKTKFEEEHPKINKRIKISEQTGVPDNDAFEFFLEFEKKIKHSKELGKKEREFIEEVLRLLQRERYIDKNFQLTEKGKENLFNDELFINQKFRLELRKNYLGLFWNKNNLKKKVLEILNGKYPDKNKATQLIVDHILQNEYIYTLRSDDKIEMWIYNKGIYIPDAQTRISEHVYDILGELFRRNILLDILEKIKVQTYISKELFFSEPNHKWQCVKNGILNLDTGELRKFNPDERFFTKIPVKYDSTAKCPNINTHLKTVLSNEEDIEVIKELAGFCLERKYRFEKAFMFSGKGRNGKGKTIGLLKYFLGSNNCSAISLQSLTNDQYAPSHLHKKLANLGADIDGTYFKKTNIFKTLTGRDSISASRKFKTHLDFVNYAKMLFCANEIPLVSDLTDGFFDRWIIIDFPFTFLSENEISKLSIKEKKLAKLRDQEIIDKITTPEELSGFLNESLIARKKLNKNKKFSYSKTTDETRQKWIRSADSFLAFCQDNLIDDFSGEVIKGILAKRYLEYCNNNKLKKVSSKHIKNILENQYGCTQSRPYIEETQVRCWKGIRFIEEQQKQGKLNMSPNINIKENKKTTEENFDSFLQKMDEGS